MKAIYIIVVLRAVYFILINLNNEVLIVGITNVRNSNNDKSFDATDNKVKDQNKLINENKNGENDNAIVDKDEKKMTNNNDMNTLQADKPRLELSEQLAAAKKQCFSLQSITHGVKPHTGTLPWMTAILHALKKRGDMPHYLCGGALISINFVLTSAHCLMQRKFKPEDLIVRVGMHLTSSMQYFQRSAIELIPHPQGDIGLIKLRKPIRYSDLINPICLPYLTTPIEWNTIIKEKSVLYAGWESLTPPPNVSYIDHLQNSIAYIMGDRKCRKSYPESDMSTNFCVYNGKNDSQFCTVNSGGIVVPLIPLPGNDLYIFPVLLGVLSIGDCPGASLMTNVESFREWINECTS